MTFPTIGLLYVIGLALLILEIFIPGMVVGLTGFVLAGYAIYECFASLQNIWLGMGMILFGGTIIPLLAWRVLRRHLLVKSQGSGEFVAADPSLKELLGQQGVTLTMLRPAGAARFGDRRVDVVSQNRFIDQQCPVEVVEVSGMRVVVKETSR